MGRTAAVILFGCVVFALAGCGGGSDSGAEATVTVTTTETTSTDTTTTDIFGDTTEATDTASAIGQGVDQTCEDLVAFFTLAKETDIARGGDSLDDVKKLAAAASDLASKAPAEPSGFNEGEPRDSLQHMADGYGTYVSLLSELGLDPGPDALLEPRVADALSGLDTDVLVGIGPWFDARCSSELKAQMEQLVNG